MASTTDDVAADVLQAITALCEDASRYSGTTRSAMVRDAAVAWRAIRGGAQPGGGMGTGS